MFAHARVRSIIARVILSILGIPLLAAGIAKKFGWELGGFLMVMLVLIALMTAAVLAQRPRVLVLRHNGVKLPRQGWADKYLFVKYVDVQSMELSLPDTERGPVTSALYVKACTDHGTVVCKVMSTSFESEAAFRSYAAELETRVKEAKEKGRVTSVTTSRKI